MQFFHNYRLIGRILPTRFYRYIASTLFFNTINKYCNYVKNPFFTLRSIHLTEYHIDTKDYYTSIVNSTSNVSISVVKSKIYV